MNAQSFVGTARDGDVYFSIPTNWGQLASVLSDPSTWAGNYGHGLGNDPIVIVTRPFGAAIPVPAQIECLAHGIENTRILYFQGRPLFGTEEASLPSPVGPVEVRIDPITGLGFVHFHTNDLVSWAIGAISHPQQYLNALNNEWTTTWLDLEGNKIRAGTLKLPTNLDSLVLTYESVAGSGGPEPGCGKNGLVRSDDGSYTIVWLSAMRW